MWSEKEREKKEVWQFPVLFPLFRARKGWGSLTLSHTAQVTVKKKKSKKGLLLLPGKSCSGDRTYFHRTFARRESAFADKRVPPPPPLGENRCQQQSPKGWRRNRQSSHSHSADCRQRFFGRPPMDGRSGSRYVYKQGCQIKIPVWGRTNNSAAYVRVLIDKGVF